MQPSRAKSRARSVDAPEPSLTADRRAKLEVARKLDGQPYRARPITLPKLRFMAQDRRRTPASTGH